MANKSGTKGAIGRSNADLERDYVDAGGNADDFDIPVSPRRKSGGDVYEEWVSFLEANGIPSENGVMRDENNGLKVEMGFNRDTNSFEYNIELGAEAGIPAIRGSVEYDPDVSLETNLENVAEEIAAKVADFHKQAAGGKQLTEDVEVDAANDIAEYLLPYFRDICDDTGVVAKNFWSWVKKGLQDNGISEPQQQAEYISQHSKALSDIRKKAMEFEKEYSTKVDALREEFDEKWMKLVVEIDLALSRSNSK